MTDDSSKPKKLSLSGSKLTLGNIDASKLRAGPSVGGARKTVQVEVRRKRAPAAPQRGGAPAPEPVVTEPVQTAAAPAAPAPSAPAADDRLTAQERAARVRALQEGLAKADAPTGGAKATADEHVDAPSEAPVETPVEAAVPEAAPEPEVPLDPIAARRAAELAELQEIEAGEERRRSEENKKHTDAHAARRQVTEDAPSDAATAANKFGPTPTEMQNRRRREAEEMAPRRPAPRREAAGRRQSGKMTITQALSGDDSRR
ncbi:translation initiation factor IF-2 associated domain-containing protein, partial [Alphaproteobacteria bacterium]|nr:translation initiation factor IF-2 associated domain-containing protein [Alphaproteobacteria bacterium]